MKASQTTKSTRLFFINVECEVRKDNRGLPVEEADKKPYRTFTYAVVAETLREAVGIPENHASEGWYELKRYAQNPEGYESGAAIFQGSTDHEQRLYCTLEAA